MVGNPGTPTLPGYRDLAPLGRGGFSEVHRAYQVQFDRWVAVKLLTFTLADDRAQQRFLRECRVAGRVSSHPNIVTVYDAGISPDGRPYMAMELYEQGSVADQVRRGGPFDVGDTLRIAIALAGALETAHRAGVVHRDVKPGNVMLAAYGQPALTDFGLSVVAERQEVSTGVDALSPHYAPPESLEQSTQSPVSDVYSLASTVYAMLAGRAPHQVSGEDGDAAGDSLGALLNRIVHEEVPPLGRPDVPEILETVLRNALARDPGQRTPTALLFAQALQTVQRELGHEVTQAVVLEAPPGSSPQERVPDVAPEPAGPPAGDADGAAGEAVEASGAGAPRVAGAAAAAAAVAGVAAVDDPAGPDQPPAPPPPPPPPPGDDLGAVGGGEAFPGMPPPPPPPPPVPGDVAAAAPSVPPAPPAGGFVSPGTDATPARGGFVASPEPAALLPLAPPAPPADPPAWPVPAEPPLGEPTIHRQRLGPPPAPPLVPPPEPSSRGPLVVALAVLLVGAIVGGVAFAATRDGDGGRERAGRTTTTRADDGTTTTSRPEDTTTTTAPTTTVPPTPVDLQVAEVAAPATAPEAFDACGATTTFGAANTIDGASDTAWRMAGDASGQSLTITLSAEAQVHAVGLVPGYAKVDPCDGTDRFTQNRRPTQVTWVFDDGTEVVQPLQDRAEMQTIEVDAATTRTIELRIDGVTGDPGRDFTAISEISVRGT